MLRPLLALTLVLRRARFIARATSGGTGSTARDLALSVEGGVRFGPLEPVATFEYLDSDDPGLSYRALRGGLNLWLHRHQVNVEAELAAVRLGSVGVLPPEKQLTMQMQISY